MSMVTSNRLLPLLAGAVVLLTVVVAVKSCAPDEAQSPVLKAVPQAPKPDADTPADTIKTLTANVSAMTSELNALRRDNTALKQENRSLIEDRQQIENNVLTRLQQGLAGTDSEGQSAETTSAIAALTAKVDSLTHRWETSTQPPSSSTSDIPVGLGLDGIRTPSGESDTLVWVNPLELTPSPDSDQGTLINRLDHSSRTAWDSARPPVEALVDKGAEAIAAASLPVYTVPRNATLIGSTGMTALLGRVPVGGQVRDPMPFKIITGKENLAANGLRIPGVEGMIWSGTAIGDWTLACVTGTLESVTFVFEDGTIQTLSTDDKQLGGSSGTSGGNSERPLGWISDSRGIPCISGERKTNAPAFLAQRMGVMALEAAGEAAAQAETTTLISDAGTASRVVSGETGQYVLGKTLSGGSDEVAQWLRERQAQSFDAVFVPAGVELAIHVDHELPIDFHSNGRKLHHEKTLFHPATVTPGSGLD